VDGADDRGRARRDARAFAAAGAATVAAIYAVGYSATAPSAHPAATPTVANHGATSRARQRVSGSAVASGYRDGRYAGTGSSAYGDISVALTVSGGRVASVEVTGATTFFPANSVSPLVPEVVSRQSAKLDVVSGATGSSQAFQGAVQQALAAARA
jgi:uncharacterized protein with FMN-binding domain